MFRAIAALILLGLTACSADSGFDPGQKTGLEIALEANSDWPYEVVGVLDIVEVGFGDSDEPEWAVGSIVLEGEEFGAQINIDGAVIARAGINVDSGKPVKAWLQAPTEQYGVKAYPVTRLEAL